MRDHEEARESMSTRLYGFAGVAIGIIVSVIPWVAILLLCSCATPPVPQELPAATAAQSKAISIAAENQAALVNAYDAELRRVFSRLLDERTAALLREATVTTSADGDGMVPVARAAEIASNRQITQDRIFAMLDAKKQEFLDDRNLETLRDLNAAVSRWIQVYAVDFGLQVQTLTTDVLGLVGVETPKLTLGDIR